MISKSDNIQSCVFATIFILLILHFELGLKLHHFGFDLPISTAENYINYLMVVTSSFQKIHF